MGWKIQLTYTYVYVVQFCNMKGFSGQLHLLRNPSNDSYQLSVETVHLVIYFYLCFRVPPVQR